MDSPSIGLLSPGGTFGLWRFRHGVDRWFGLKWHGDLKDGVARRGASESHVPNE